MPFSNIESGKDYRNSFIERALNEENRKLRSERLEELKQEYFGDSSEEEMREELGEQTLEEYFDQELESMDLFMIQYINNDDEVALGQSLAVIVDLRGDTIASFVSCGYATECIWRCAIKFEM